MTDRWPDLHGAAFTQPTRSGEFRAVEYAGDPSVHEKRRKEAEKNRKARLAREAAKRRRVVDRILERDLAELDREAQARRDLEEHARRLAAEIRAERSRHEPNPWLKLGDEGYVDPQEFKIRRRLQQGLDPLAPEPQRGSAPAYRCIGSGASGHSVGSPDMLENGRCFGCRQKLRARGGTSQRPSLSPPTEWRAHATGGHEHPLNGPCSVCRRPGR